MRLLKNRNVTYQVNVYDDSEENLIYVKEFNSEDKAHRLIERIKDKDDGCYAVMLVNTNEEYF